MSSKVYMSEQFTRDVARLNSKGTAQVYRLYTLYIQWLDAYDRMKVDKDDEAGLARQRAVKDALSLTTTEGMVLDAKAYHVGNKIEHNWPSYYGLLAWLGYVVPLVYPDRLPKSVYEELSDKQVHPDQWDAVAEAFKWSDKVRAYMEGELAVLFSPQVASLLKLVCTEIETRQQGRAVEVKQC